jgi:hypothetical protein
MNQGKETKKMQRHELENKDRWGRLGKHPKNISSQALQDKTGGQKGQHNHHEADESGKEGIQAADRPYLSDQGNRTTDTRRSRGSTIREGELFPIDFIEQEPSKKESEADRRGHEPTNNEERKRKRKEWHPVREQSRPQKRG